MNKIKIKVPATTANIGPGYDVFGAALELYNETEFCLTETKTDSVNVNFNISGYGETELPKNKTNLLWKAFEKTVLHLSNKKWPKSLKNKEFNITVKNNIPLASGLGSSASANLAGILAAYKVLHKSLDSEDILKLGVEFEGHPDNIVPAFAGGFCISYGDKEKIKFFKFDVPKIKAVVCNPNFGLSTQKARKVLPKEYKVKDVVFNCARSSLLIAALHTKNYDLLNDAMSDKLHQPYRKKLIPNINNVFKAALNEGAYGVAVSGAGPSVIALSSSQKAEKIKTALIKSWKNKNIGSKGFVLNFTSKGALVK